MNRAMGTGHVVVKNSRFLERALLVLSLLVLNIAATDLKADTRCEWEFLRTPGYSIPQNFASSLQQFKSDYGPSLLEFEGASTENNQVWIDIALRGAADNFFFMVENSKMKEANDHVFEGDKEMVTVLTNMHKKFFLTALKIMLPQEINNYSDFKVVSGVVKISLNNSQVEEFKSAVISAYEYSLLRVKSILDLYDPLLFSAIGIEHWMKVGFGGHADEANLAVREVRRHRGFFHADYFDERTQKALHYAQLYTEYSRIKIEAMALFSVGGYGRRPETFEDMFVEVKDSTFTAYSVTPPRDIHHTKTYIPSPALFELMRKEKTPEDLTQKIQQRFGYEMSLKDGKLLIEYAQGIDLFSPALFIPERVQANLLEAQFGGMTVDFVGMGADNWFIVALALAKRNRLTRELLQQIRQNEQNLTVLINLRKRQLRRFLTQFFTGADHPISEVLCSGDDCVLHFLRGLEFDELKMLFTQLLYTYSQRKEPYRLRFSSIDQGFPADLRTKVATLGELVEKDLRKVLQKEISFSAYKDITIGVLIEKISTGIKVHPILVTKQKNKEKLVEVSSQAMSQIQDKFANYLGSQSVEMAPSAVYHLGQ